MKEYFFDTYAAIELIKGNPKFSRYNVVPITITFLNLLEIAYITLLEQCEEKSKEMFLKFKEFVVDISDETVLEAIQFWAKNKKMSLSYADCLGYIFSKDNGLIFLMGDDAFKNMPNVEFLK